MLKDRMQLVVSQLVSQKILEVMPHQIRLHRMIIPSERLVKFHLAISACLNGDEVTQLWEDGYTTNKVNLVGKSGQNWRISSNLDEPTGTILLTRKLLTELYAVFDYFLNGIERDTNL